MYKQVQIYVGGDLDHDSYQRNEKHERVRLYLRGATIPFRGFRFFRPLRGPNCLTLLVAMQGIKHS
jgi:hypothetical protein